MNESVTVREVMTRSYVGVSEGDPVSGAAELMHEEGLDSTVVLRGSEAAGMLHAGDVVSLIASGDDPADTTVAEAMTETVATIDASADLATAVSTIANRDARPMVVVEGDEVVGVLTERDVITAHAVLVGMDEREDVPPTSTPEDEIAVGEDYPTQGVCEVCGSLARDLTAANGQLLCADCLEI